MKERGRLVELNKLNDYGGRIMKGFKDKQVVTGGPFTESKEVIGGYWVIEAGGYDEAVEPCRDCPTVESWGVLVIREVEIFEQVRNEQPSFGKATAAVYA